ISPIDHPICVIGIIDGIGVIDVIGVICVTTGAIGHGHSEHIQYIIIFIFLVIQHRTTTIFNETSGSEDGL
ncbi:unnamed protein product, partial [Rotaria sordida]